MSVQTETPGRSEIPARLGRGAEVLGSLWRAGTRCGGGWSRSCPDEGRTTPFCLAKAKWLELLFDLQPAFLADPWWTGDEEYFVIEAMMCRQASMTGLTVTVQDDKGREWKVGPKGTVWKTLWGLAQVSEDEVERIWKLHSTQIS